MLRVLKKVDSRLVAAKMLGAVEGFNNSLSGKKILTAAEKRHQLRMRCLEVLENGNEGKVAEVLCKKVQLRPRQGRQEC